MDSEPIKLTITILVTIIWPIVWLIGLTLPADVRPQR
jgi:hypothetical protein